MQDEKLLYSLLICFNALLKTIPVNIALNINTNQSIKITIISKRLLFANTGAINRNEKLIIRYPNSSKAINTP